MPALKWISTGEVRSKSFTCGFCGKDVAPHHAFYTDPASAVRGYIYICPNCSFPTFFAPDGKQTPGVRSGRDVAGVSDDGIQKLYLEARDCMAAGCYTAAVLICRKMLMNIAVHHEAEEGKRFIEYVDYLKSKGFIPPNGGAWVDKIRQSGNEATHEIRIMTEPEAKMILGFIEMLLRFIYEFPSLVK